MPEDMIWQRSEDISSIKSFTSRTRIKGHTLSRDVVDENTGEVIAQAETVVDADIATAIQNAAIPAVWVHGVEREVKVLSNLMVDIESYVPELSDPKSIGITEQVYYPVLKKLMEENEGEELIKAIEKSVNELIPKHITKEDIFATVNYNMHIEEHIGNKDDIGPLGKQKNKSGRRAVTESVPYRSYKNGKSCKRENDHSGHRLHYTSVTYKH